ncbi:MAG: energy transducer TonB [Proteobacteria bacterium]|nr:energy transducer TonB [Pseudomonadota bacterium]
MSSTITGFRQPHVQDRALLWCVLASIVLHVLVLFGMSRQEAPAPPSKTLLVLTATLAPFSAAPRAPVPAPQPERAPPRVPEPVPPPRPALTKPLPSSIPAPQKTAPAEPAQTAPPASVPASPSVMEPSTPPAAPSQARAAPQAPAGVPGTEAAARSGSEADAGTREQYRLALIVAARRYKRYPAVAMEKGWQGRVEVRMVIGANGMIASASIKTSSGHEVLDNQALDMLRKGKTTVPIPVSLRGREFDIDIPVIFNLDNPNS